MRFYFDILFFEERTCRKILWRVMETISACRQTREATRDGDELRQNRALGGDCTSATLRNTFSVQTTMCTCSWYSRMEKVTGVASE